MSSCWAAALNTSHKRLAAPRVISTHSSLNEYCMAALQVTDVGPKLQGCTDPDRNLDCFSLLAQTFPSLLHGRLVFVEEDELKERWAEAAAAV